MEGKVKCKMSKLTLTAQANIIHQAGRGIENKIKIAGSKDDSQDDPDRESEMDTSMISAGDCQDDHDK